MNLEEVEETDGYIVVAMMINTVMLVIRFHFGQLVYNCGKQVIAMRIEGIVLLL